MLVVQEREIEPSQGPVIRIANGGCIDSIIYYQLKRIKNENEEVYQGILCQKKRSISDRK
jgi:hypothetical protein